MRTWANQIVLKDFCQCYSLFNKTLNQILRIRGTKIKSIRKGRAIMTQLRYKNNTMRIISISQIRNSIVMNISWIKVSIWLRLNTLQCWGRPITMMLLNCKTQDNWRINLFNHLMEYRIRCFWVKFNIVKAKIWVRGSIQKEMIFMKLLDQRISYRQIYEN